jgi:hypothetical protein
MGIARTGMICLALMLGMIEARKNGLPAQNGAMASWSYFATNSFSNHMVNSMGIEGRNMFEVGLRENDNRENKK